MTRRRTLSGLCLLAAMALIALASPGVRVDARRDPPPPDGGDVWSAPGATRGGIPPVAAGRARNPRVDDHLGRLGDEVTRARQGGVVPSTRPADVPSDLAPLLTAGIIKTDGGARAQVYIDYDGAGAALVPPLQALGADVQIVSDDAHTLQAEVDLGTLDQIAALPGVRFVRPPEYVTTHTGSVLTQGDALLLADQARSTLGVDGTGVRVGVISDGINGLVQSQLSGDLGPVTSQSFRADHNINAGAEGTAMLEIVHDLAPGAELWFANAGTSLEFANAVNFLAQNVDVVVDDLGNNDGPYDGTSIMSTASSSNSTNPARRERTHVTAVGNEALDHYQESFVWSGWVLNYSGQSAQLQSWAATANTTDAGFGGTCTGGVTPPYCDNTFAVPPGGTAIGFVQWDDPWNASSNDYDAFVYDFTGGTYVSVSAGVQNGTQHPIEIVGLTNTSGTAHLYGLEVAKFAGVAKTFDIFLRCSPFCLPTPAGTDFNFNTMSSSVPDNSDAGGNVLSLGAIYQGDPGTDTIETYSSRGPTNDGRTKPDITAVDGVSVTANGGFFNPFFGTSAASPHAGAIAALVLQCFPALKAGEGGDNPAADRAALKSKLTSGLADLGTAGVDNTYGAGRMNAVTSASGCDSDQDGVANLTDNCKTVANADQLNTDNAPIVTAGLPDDNTVPNGDKLGDACDPDKDNDGLADNVEAGLGPGGPFHALCPSASANTDPLKADTDGNRALDGAECAFGTDPAIVDGSTPITGTDTDHDGLIDPLELTIGSNPNVPDTDGDGISDGIEFRAYNTSPLLVDTDGDGCSDGREISSVNLDKATNSTDLALIAQNFGSTTKAALDLNKDGKVNSTDLFLAANNFSSSLC